MRQGTAAPGTRRSSACAPTRPSTAILTDVDGTLAPIVDRPELAAVPAQRERAAAGAERQLRPGRLHLRPPGAGGAAAGRGRGDRLRRQPRARAADAGRGGAAARPRSGRGRAGGGGVHRRARRRPAGGRRLRLEDKGPIQALHWRGADDERAAEARAREIAAAAGRAELEPRWGRKVLELRPLGGGGKDSAVAALLAGEEIAAAVFAGDDRTDLDAFRRLRELCEEGRLEAVLCVGVDLTRGASGADRRVRPRRRRAGRLGEPARGAGRLAMPYTDLLRVTVLLTGAEATALAAITAVDGEPRRRHEDAHGGRRLVADRTDRRLLPGTPEPRGGQPARHPRAGAHGDLAAARVARPDRRRPPLAGRASRRSPRAPSASSSPASPRSPPATPCSSRWPGTRARPRCWRSSSATGSSSTSSPTRPCARSSWSAPPACAAAAAPTPEWASPRRTGSAAPTAWSTAS